MEQHSHDHHEEHSVCYTVGILFIVVLAAIFLIGVL